MKTIKVIDLLNKIANGEEVPIHFICNGHSYTIVKYPVYGKEIINYEDEENDYLFGSEYELGLILNNKIEVIEEDKEIEELDIESIKVDYVNNVCNRYDLIEIFGSSINKLRKELNELKKGK